MALNRKATTDAVEILHRKFYEGNPERLKSLAVCRANDEIARKIQALRTKAVSRRPNLPNLSAPRLRLFAGLRISTMKGIRSRCSDVSQARWIGGWKWP